MSGRKSHRKRHHSSPNVNGGFTTSSPIFYTIPWTPTDYSITGLGPGQSDTFMPHLPPCRNGKLDYSKAGFTYYKKGQCICGFLTGLKPMKLNVFLKPTFLDLTLEYRKQYNQKSSNGSSKPWWNGRELTSKFDPKYPCYPMHIEGLSTYTKDFKGERGHAADMCYPEGEIERAMRLIQSRGYHWH